MGHKSEFSNLLQLRNAETLEDRPCALPENYTIINYLCTSTVGNSFSLSREKKVPRNSVHFNLKLSANFKLST